MSTLANPHDKFFKATFRRKEAARDFLRHYLPADVVALLQLESLEYVKDSFIDKHLQEFYSDLLLKVSLITGAQGWIYILIEHKSYQEPVIAFHLLRYMVNIWDMVLKHRKPREPLRLPVILPVVLYHGKTGWRAGQHLHELVPCPDVLRSFLPDFQYVLWDASAYADENITGIVILRSTLLLFKYIVRPELRERLPGIFGLLNTFITKRRGLEYLETMLKYILSASPTDAISYEELKRTVDEAFPQIGGTVMPTIADVLREEGLTKGIIQTAREDVIDNLEVRFGTVPLALKEEIQGISDPVFLKHLHRQAIQVPSLKDFEALLEKSPA
jgi:predicted transposase/invertase (TIGR01784 family)